MSRSVPPALRLATEIAAQFRHVPPTDAAADIAEHIRVYWDPRMRMQLLAHVAHAGATCDPHVAAAAGLIASPARVIRAALEGSPSTWDE